MLQYMFVFKYFVSTAYSSAKCFNVNEKKIQSLIIHFSVVLPVTLATHSNS